MAGIFILAAGPASRMGSPKQNLIYQGQTLLQRAIETALASVCRPVFVILGANSEVILPTIENKPVNIIHNPDWQEGMASSIRLGTTELQKTEPTSDAVILMLCDQPFVDASLLDQLARSGSTKGIAACAYNDTAGPPVLFGAAYFDELLLLSGQEGAKKLLLKYREDVFTVPFPSGGVDVDTIENYVKLIERQ
jgi:molybdenum cofactor cytidylyltransferase